MRKSVYQEYGHAGESDVFGESENNIYPRAYDRYEELFTR
jgi:hypothetical protein